MNARQKAKKYKKLAELNRIKAEAHDRLLKSEAFKHYLNKNLYGTVETIKVVRSCDKRTPYEFIRKVISEEFGKFFLDNKLIYFEVDENNDVFTTRCKVIGTMKVCKDWWEDKK